MKAVAIVPQQIQIAAPSAAILELIATAAYGPRPGGRLGVSSMSREDGRVMVAFTMPADHLQRHVLKEMIIRPPYWVRYHHLSGPFAGATEELRLRPEGEATEIRLTAEFNVQDDDNAFRLRKLQIEQAALDHLLEIKHAAEERVRAHPGANGAARAVMPISGASNEQQLLEAIERQEEMEWGHAGHGRGVARVAVSLAEAALLPARQVDSVRRAALLHDAGKLSLDSALWSTRGTLTHEQRTLMEAHPQLGYDIAKGAGLPDTVLTGILYHHERWDGQGYPKRLAGEDVPLRGRILYLAETVDSMMRATYRRPPMRVDQVVSALERGAGRQWDPSLARTAARIIRGR